MDKENVELIEATVKGLQDKISSLNMELKDKQKELEDANKPVISEQTLHIIEDVVNKTIEDYNFDCGMFEYEFNLNYDNKLELSDLTFTDAYELVEAVVTKIEKQFKIIKDDETNN
tara:strand:- start:130 stop:477 length:348 start_codon:yes stop_codon:yes gene_type:complete